MRIARFDSKEAAAQAVKDGLIDVGFSVNPLHDDPPGDWYIEVHVLCLEIDGEFVQSATGYQRGFDVNGVPSYGYAYFTDFMLGPVAKKPGHQIRREEAALDEPVEEKARMILTKLSEAAP